MSDSNPGTVSKILWHFTGGPAWDPVKNKQARRLKSPIDAYAKLKSIIKSRTLKVGSFHEVVKVVLPALREYSPSQKKVVIVKNKKITMYSSAVCCLADIPAVHLGYHAKRYGQFAIGFHRQSVVQQGFNPVLYTLPTTEVIRHIYEGLSSLESIDPGEVLNAVESIEAELMELDDSSDLTIDTSQVASEAEVMQGYAREAQTSIQNFIAFIKTFEPTEFNSIYCEREWRSVKDFKFASDDVAMIVVPNNVGTQEFFKPLLREAKNLKIAGKIPIVPWEDLVE